MSCVGMVCIECVLHSVFSYSEQHVQYMYIVRGLYTLYVMCVNDV